MLSETDLVLHISSWYPLPRLNTYHRGTNVIMEYMEPSIDIHSINRTRILWIFCKGGTKEINRNLGIRFSAAFEVLFGSQSSRTT